MKRTNEHLKVEQKFDIVFEGSKAQNGFGLRYEGYDSGDMIQLQFYRGQGLCLYKKDVKKLVEYLNKKCKEML